MKRSRFKFIVLLVIIGMVVAACASAEEVVPTATSVVNVEESPVLAGSIVGGVLEPARYAQLSFQAAGVVTELNVAEGDLVQAGDVLAVIGDRSAAQAQVESARLALVQAENALSDLLDLAGLSYADAWQRSLDAEAALSAAETSLDDFDQDAHDDDIDAAKEVIADREQDLQDAEEDLEDYLDLDEDNTTRKAREDDVENAEEALRDAKIELQELENEFDQLLLDVRAAEELLTQAEKDRDELADGPAPNDLALAQANVSAAEAQLTAAETVLDNYTLKAPFSGTIAKVDLRENEMTIGGTPVVMLADFSEWVIKTDDLTEFEIQSVEIGQLVNVWAEVLPETQFSGEVVAIELVSQKRSGDVTYTVTIQPLVIDLNLFWGMNMSIALDPF